MNKNLPIIEVPASGKKTWYGGAYTLAFVYSKSGNFLIKGYSEEVKEYLKKNHTHWFANFTFFHKGENRSFWKFWKEDIFISNNDHRTRKRSGRKKMTVSVYRNEQKNLNFKRLPKHWIPEFDQL